MCENMCEWCSDLRNVEPAGYIGCNDPEMEAWLKKEHEQKHFIFIRKFEYQGEYYKVPEVILECPHCGHKFTEEDYDDYMSYW